MKRKFLEDLGLEKEVIDKILDEGIFVVKIWDMVRCRIQKKHGGVYYGTQL